MLDRSYSETLDQIRREQYADRNWVAVQDRLAAEAPIREAVRRAETLKRMRASSALRIR